MNHTAKLLMSIAMAAMIVAPAAWADGDDDDDYAPHKPEAQDFVHGAPENPTEAWTLAAGGRIYDNWWEALDREEPTATHPSYPKVGKQEGAVTWRCKECHAWDYRGKDGIYASGSHYTGFPGIDGAIGKPVEAIENMLRGRVHGYTKEMISDDELARVAAFVSRGQVDMSKFIDLKTRKIIAGNVDRGREVFQTTCAACHGYDGKLLNWGDKDEPAYVGTEGRDVPDEVMHKILSAHTGVQMINLRAFPLDYAVDVLAYTATLPEK